MDKEKLIKAFPQIKEWKEGENPYLNLPARKLDFIEWQIFNKDGFRLFMHSKYIMNIIIFGYCTFYFYPRLLAIITGLLLLFFIYRYIINFKICNSINSIYDFYLNNTKGEK